MYTPDFADKTWKHYFMVIACSVLFFDSPAYAQEEKLFDGKSLDHWDFTKNGWYIAEGSMTCRMQMVKQKNGEFRKRGMGYIWSKKQYQDFELRLSYKLSEAANSGVFFRTDKDNPVQGGFEIQLMDDAGYQKLKGKKDPKNLNGAFYDCQGASKDTQKPAGEWNQFTLTCKGSKLSIKINGEVVNEADMSRWDTARKNPDGSANKFKTALKDLPHTGYIGFQNHGQQVWFKDVIIREL